MPFNFETTGFHVNKLHYLNLFMNVCFISSNGINYILYWRLFWLDGPKILCKVLERGKKNEEKLPYTYFWVVALFPRSPTTLFGLCVQVISLDPLHIFQFGFQLDFYHTTMWFCTAQIENAALQFHLFWTPVLNKHILILEKLISAPENFMLVWGMVWNKLAVIV